MVGAPPRAPVHGGGGDIANVDSIRIAAEQLDGIHACVVIHDAMLRLYLTKENISTRSSCFWISSGSAESLSGDKTLVPFSWLVIMLTLTNGLPAYFALNW